MSPQNPSDTPLVDVRHLVRTVQDAGGELTVLRDITFSIQPGETVALVGASGSGKSTLLGLVAGLDVPTSGEVWLDGQSLFTLDEDARAAVRASRLGFVFQSFQLMPSLSALENVMLPLELLGRRDARAQAVAMLERVGLGQRLGHLPRLLSGGEQQRVALARAFVVQPRLLLADEPTGSLDHATGEAVLQLMMDMNREQGTTLLLVTHDLKLARACQRVLRMDAGQLVEEDAVAAEET
ncbi:ABC transporter ATP-binding protein [Amphibiibacter pelophylacis]|uniref:ATP-binding cassette domain-containing protein n=1 Tax=Amphibiibacter pelophylacis TaxID=1799477 RepID=A0ACC6NYN6_9BURK